MTTLDTKLDVHNKFHIERFTNGKKTGEAFAYNTVLRNFYAYMNSIYGPRNKAHFYQLAIGTGTSTPTATNTTLQTFLVRAANVVVSEEFAYPTSTKVQKATFMADVTKTGTISEVGLESGQGWNSTSPVLVTRALLQDAEGNLITIDKGPNDVLIITSTIYVTFTHNFDLVPIPSNNFLLQELFNHGSISNTLLSTLQDISLTTEVQGLLTLFNRTDAINDSYYLRDTAYGIPNIPSMTYTYDTSSGTYTGYGRAATSSTINNVMVPYIASPLGIKRITSTEFPAYTTKPITVGQGDGATTDFACPIPLFVENSDVIKIDNTTLTRGVDYTIDNNSNTALSPSAGINKEAVLLDGAVFISDTRYCICGSSSVTDRRRYIPFFSNLPASAYVSSYAVFDTLTAKAANTLHIPTYRATTHSSAGAIYFKFLLEYSFDKIEWQTAVLTPTINIPSVPLSTSSPSYVIYTDPSPTHKFETVTARYWRLSLVEYTTARTFSLYSAAYDSFFGYVGDPIKFTTPPPTGSVITLQAQLTTPFKTSDYVLDHTVTLNI